MVGPAIKPSPAQHHVCLQVRMNSYYPTLPSPIPHPKPACSMLFVKKLQRRWKAERWPEEAKTTHYMYGLAPAGINIQVTTITGQGTIIGTFWGAVKMAVCKGPRSLDPTFWGHKGQYACHADVDASACVHSVSIRIWNTCMTPVPMHNLTFLTEALTTLDQQCSLHVAKDNSMLSYLYCRVSDGFKIRITGPDYLDYWFPLKLPASPCKAP